MGRGEYVSFVQSPTCRAVIYLAGGVWTGVTGVCGVGGCACSFNLVGRLWSSIVWLWFLLLERYFKAPSLFMVTGSRVTFMFGPWGVCWCAKTVLLCVWLRRVGGCPGAHTLGVFGLFVCLDVGFLAC